MSKILVIKIGTNSILDDQGKIDKKIFVSLATQIYYLKKKYKYQIVLVSSGAVGLGREKINNQLHANISPGEKKQFLSAIGQSVLMHEYTKAFAYYDIIVAQGLLTRIDFADRKRYLSMRNVLQHLLANDIVPIINENDFLCSDEIDFTDNDELAAYIAGMLGAEKLIILSDIQGVYNKHPSYSDAQKIDLIQEITPEILEMADEKKSSGGSGGMLSKFKTAKLTMSLGISMHIAYAKEPNVLLDITEQKNIGTQFVPNSKSKISGIRRWLATGAYPQGKIRVSTLISDLLQQKKRASILASGICEIQNNFQAGEVIEILSVDTNQVLGYGITKFSSQEIKSFLNRELKERKDIIIIHTDYFLSY